MVPNRARICFHKWSEWTRGALPGLWRECLKCAAVDYQHVEANRD